MSTLTGRHTRLVMLLVAAVALAGCSRSPESGTPAVTVMSGKAADVKAAVAAQKGRVIVIDFWATY